MSSSTPGRRPGLAAVVAGYALVRIVMVALVAGVLVLTGVPLLIALLVGLIVALPLSMVLFRGLRGQLDEALATARERRAVQRAALRSRLRGDPEPVAAPADVEAHAEPGDGRSEQRPTDEHAEPQSDRGER
jgi:Protein of unknown function (DUF4229)